MKLDNLIYSVSQILYNNIIGDSDPEIPTDEYRVEARDLLHMIDVENKEPTVNEINVALTTVMKHSLNYDFTEWELANGAYRVTAEEIWQAIVKYKSGGSALS